MRYTWIDGIYVEVKSCPGCPFFSTEYECFSQCQYPHDPSQAYDPFQAFKDDVADDCPLKEKE